MKTLFRLKLIPFVCFALLSCTSSEVALKKQAAQFGETKVLELFHKEATENIKQSQILHDAYIEYMRQHSEVLIDKVQFQGEDSATVHLKAKILPLRLRRTLLDIVSQVGLDKSRRFNITEAAVLVRQEKNITEVDETQLLGNFRFRKRGSVWVAE